MIRHTATTLLVLASLSLAPVTGAQASTHEEVFAFATAGSLIVSVTYDDGLASTRMGFVQLEGARGGPDERLSPTADCTEWVGVFSQLLVLARSEDRVNASEIHISGALAMTPGAKTDHVDARFALDALGTHSWRGSLLVCDDPAGLGLIRINVVLDAPPIVDATTGLVRLTVEDSA